MPASGSPSSRRARTSLRLFLPTIDSKPDNDVREEVSCQIITIKKNTLKKSGCFLNHFNRSLLDTQATKATQYEAQMPASDQIGVTVASEPNSLNMTLPSKIPTT